MTSEGFFSRKLLINSFFYRMGSSVMSGFGYEFFSFIRGLIYAPECLFTERCERRAGNRTGFIIAYIQNGETRLARNEPLTS